MSAHSLIAMGILRLSRLSRGWVEALIFRSSNRNKREGHSQSLRLSSERPRVSDRTAMSEKRILHYDVIVPRQNERLPVFVFAAGAADVARFARRECAGRDEAGTLRGFADDDRLLLDRGAHLISEFFRAVRHVFQEGWDDKTPKASRFVHGTGIIAMGYVMEAIHVMTGAESREAFAKSLRPLKSHTAWTSSEWEFGDERRRWNGLQNVPSDIRRLSLYLVSELKRSIARADAA
jgi:hypothetical protein